MIEVSKEPLLIKTSEIIAERGEGPWYEPVLTDGRNVAGLICDAPGGMNDAHFHPDFNEFWVVLKGELEFEIGDYPVVNARKSDIVMSPAGDRHLIRTVGEESSIRLHISKIGSDHSHRKERNAEIKPFPDQAIPPNLVHTTLDPLIQQLGEGTPITLRTRAVDGDPILRRGEGAPVRRELSRRSRACSRLSACARAHRIVRQRRLALNAKTVTPVIAQERVVEREANTHGFEVVIRQYYQVIFNKPGTPRITGSPSIMD